MIDWIQQLVLSGLMSLTALFGGGDSFGAQPAFTAFQGGTGTSSPSGILYGDETIRLKTVTIGDNLTFADGTLSATGGSSFGYPFPLNATSTRLTFEDGIALSTNEALYLQGAGDENWRIFGDTSNNINFFMSGSPGGRYFNFGNNDSGGNVFIIEGLTGSTTIKGLLSAQGGATTTDLQVTSDLTFGGVTGDGWSDFCESITGSADLCDGDDASGDSGNAFDYLFPSNATTTQLAFSAGLTSFGSKIASTTAVVCKQSAACDYTSVQAAIDAGNTSLYLRNGVYSEQVTLANAKTTIIGESLGAIIQCNGLTQSPCIDINAKDEPHFSNFAIRETNATANGVGIDFGDSAIGKYENLRISNFATSTQAVDSVSNTFYNVFDKITYFNPKVCIDLGGSQANNNTFSNSRCRPMVLAGSYGAFLTDARGTTLQSMNFEATSTTHTTGIYIGPTSRETTIVNPWIEANAVGINITAGANRTTLIGGSITSNGTDITDNGTQSVFLNTSDTGVLVNHFGHASTTALSVSGLTASRPVFTDPASGLSSSGTVGAIEAAVGSQNILLETEIDGCSELAALLDGETGSCNGTSGPVFPNAPTFSGSVTMPYASTTAISIGSDFISDLSTGLSISAAGAVTVDTSGTWSGNAVTATALAGNGANCAANQYPLGVDASGAVESCTADANTTYTAGDNLTLTGTDIDLDATLAGLTGITSTGNLDFGGASFLEIPNGTGPTADDPGELAHDTSGNQLILDDFVVGSAVEKIWSVTVASTSPAFNSGGLLPIPLHLDGYTITALRCYVVGGTSKVVAVEDASANSSEDITCATTATSDDGSITNATYTAAELANIDFGATSGTVDYVTISAFGTITRE